MSSAKEPERTEGSCLPAIGNAEFEELARLHSPRATRLAWACVNDRTLAEDFVQEALRRLYERRSSYPLRTHFGPLLVKTVARLCLDERREWAAGPGRQAALKARADSAPESGDPAVRAEREELFAHITEGVSKLPRKERLCLLLTVCEGQSYQEVAESLSLSFAEVNNAVHRARTELRKVLGPLVSGQSRSDRPGGGSEAEKGRSHV